MKYCTLLFIPLGGTGYLELCEYPSVITRGHGQSLHDETETTKAFTAEILKGCVLFQFPQ